MNLSSLLVGIFIVTFIALLIAYSVLSSGRPSITTGLSPKEGNLSTPTKVGSTDDIRNSFLSPAGATLSAYLYCTVNNKTATLVPSQNPITLLNIGNVLRFEILPGGVSSTTKTRLVVMTQSPRPDIEEIIVPQFPEQKWVHLTIVREGRRFTVYYNGQPVSSQRTQFFPVINSSQLSFGDKRLIGEFALPKVTPIPLKTPEIQAELRDTSTTRNKPYKPMDFSAFFKLGCPNGLFCFSTSSPPTDPLKMWSSPYA